MSARTFSRRGIGVALVDGMVLVLAAGCLLFAMAGLLVAQIFAKEQDEDTQD